MRWLVLATGMAHAIAGAAQLAPLTAGEVASVQKPAASVAPSGLGMWGLQLGRSARSETATLTLERTVKPIAVRRFHLQLMQEIAIGQWSTFSDLPSSEHERYVQFGWTPKLRWESKEARWFIEAGIGLNLVTPKYRAGPRHFSTVFNFGDHIAIGRSLGATAEVSVRAQHFSNAGIRQPNPGEDFVQLRIALQH